MIVTIDEAVRLLKAGKNVGIPTETVYGLAALYDHPAAIDSIFTLKGRPRENPLIIHVADVQAVESLAADIPESFYALTAAFWPGPLALALPVKQEFVLESVRAGLQNACFRMPDHLQALEIIAKSGPLVMPSANLSGKPSPTDFRAVEEDFGSAFPVVDGGGCVKGLESTILIYQDGLWHLGRHGSLSLEEIERVLGFMPSEKKGSKALCPGQMWRHYAPKARLIREQDEAEAIIGFEGRSYSSGKLFLSLGETPEAASSRLYALLRELDRRGIKSAWIDTDFPEDGLWRTLRERIERASGT